MEIPKEIKCHGVVLTLVKDEPMFKHTEDDLNTIMMRNRRCRTATYMYNSYYYRFAYNVGGDVNKLIKSASSLVQKML